MTNKTEILVFGSNLSGIHGAGAARYALLHHGAVMGQGMGLQGSSYALPTKGVNISFMPSMKLPAFTCFPLGDWPSIPSTTPSPASEPGE